MTNRSATSFLLLALFLLLRSAPAQRSDPQAERLLFDLTNQIRAQHHLPSLAWDPSLTTAARSHAAHMIIASSSLEHQYPSEPDLVTRAAQAGALFSTISENLARGRTSAAALEQLWMSTPIHRANLLDPHLDSIGIGVLEQNGILYAVQDFTHATPLLTQDEIEAHVIALLRRQGLAPVVSSPAARAACQQHATLAETARLIVQWDGDTSQLPGVLLEQLGRSQFQSAFVGACPSDRHANGFANARVAVLLF